MSIEGDCARITHGGGDVRAGSKKPCCSIPTRDLTGSAIFVHFRTRDCSSPMLRPYLKPRRSPILIMAVVCTFVVASGGLFLSIDTIYTAFAIVGMPLLIRGIFLPQASFPAFLYRSTLSAKVVTKL